MYRDCYGFLHACTECADNRELEGFEMDMGLTWKKLLGEGMSNQQIETMLLLGIVPIILLTIWFMVFLYNNLAPELEK